MSEVADRTYHHGDLKVALLAAARSIVEEQGADAFTLREAARRAGVSHGAPAHHFGDKTGLLTQLAEQVMSDRENIEHELLEYRRSHLNRLQKGQVASRATTLAHLDLLIVLDELDQSLTRVAALARDLHEPNKPLRLPKVSNMN